MTVLGIWTPAVDLTDAALERVLRRQGGNDVRRADDNRLAVVAANGWGGRAICDFNREPPLTVVGEIRIDNRDELCDSLGANRATNLGALLTASYLRWGVRCGLQLLGDFSLACWEPGSRCLRLLRDPMGVRPVYYASTKQGFAWSSDFSQVRRFLTDPSALDRRMVVDYLGEFPDDEERTVLRDVRRLPAGSALTVEDYRARGVDRYYSLIECSSALPAGDYAEQLRDKLQEATSARLASAVRCGSMMSGGLDSSMISALASRRLRARSAGALHTFSAIFEPTLGCDERTFQAQVVGAVASDHTEFSASPLGSAGDWSALIDVFGQPGPIGPHWLAWSAAEAAARRGVDVMLTGIDGDRVVSHGEGRLVELARQRQFVELIRQCWDHGHRSPFGRLSLFGRQLALGFMPFEWLRAWDARKSWLSPAMTEARRWIRPSLLRETNVRERVAERLRRALNPEEGHLRSLTASDRVADLELLAALGRAFNVEFRHPFYDRRVVEFCFRLPSEQRRRGASGRFVLRQAMRGLVPEEVRLRTSKAYFDRAYRAFVKDCLGRNDFRVFISNFENIADFVRPSSLALCQSRLRAANAAAAWETEQGPSLDFFWRSVVLSRWLEGLDAERASVRA